MKVDQVPSSTPLDIFFENDKAIEREDSNKPEQELLPLFRESTGTVI